MVLAAQPCLQRCACGLEARALCRLPATQHAAALLSARAGLAALALVSLNVLRGTKGKLAQFLADVTSEDAESAVRLEGPKAD